MERKSLVAAVAVLLVDRCKVLGLDDDEFATTGVSGLEELLYLPLNLDVLFSLKSFITERGCCSWCLLCKDSLLEWN